MHHHDLLVLCNLYIELNKIYTSVVRINPTSKRVFRVFPPGASVGNQKWPICSVIVVCPSYESAYLLCQSYQ